jgi:DNA primase
LIPFRNEKGEVFAYQGRSFGKEKPKYITIRLDNNTTKIFGLDRVDNSKQIYAVEGPLDSLFLDNCVAVGGADLSKLKNDIIIIFDNEPRNREICKQMNSSIRFDKKVVIWPDSMKHKDINDMIMSGYTKEQIQEIINDNIFSGAAARLRFIEWKKIDEGSMGRTV